MYFPYFFKFIHNVLEKLNDLCSKILRYYEIVNNSSKVIEVNIKAGIKAALFRRRIIEEYR